MKITSGMAVSVHYTLTDESGEILDTSKGGGPLVYLHGYGNMIPGLEKALEGVAVGFKSKVTVPPTEAYGEINPAAIFEAPLKHFPDDMKLTPGVKVQADGEHGPVTLTVVRLTDTGVILDANHPLAGKTLHFDVEVTEIRPATSEELEHGHVHSGDGHHHH